MLRSRCCRVNRALEINSSRVQPGWIIQSNVPSVQSVIRTIKVFAARRLERGLVLTLEALGAPQFGQLSAWSETW